MSDRFQEQKQPSALSRRLRWGQWRLVTLCVLSAVLLLSFLDGAATARSTPESFADLAQKLLPAVVNISTTSATKAQEEGATVAAISTGVSFRRFFSRIF